MWSIVFFVPISLLMSLSDTRSRDSKSGAETALKIIISLCFALYAFMVFHIAQRSKVNYSAFLDLPVCVLFVSLIAMYLWFGFLINSKLNEMDETEEKIQSLKKNILMQLVLTCGLLGGRSLVGFLLMFTKYLNLGPQTQFLIVSYLAL